MLVTLDTGTAISAGGSETFTYSPQSVQKVMIGLDDDSGTDVFTSNVTVQIGSKTVCNGIPSWGLWGLSSLVCDAQGGGADATFVIDFGSIQVGPAENLYVTIGATAAITTTDVSAIVNEPMAGDFPLRITNYNDNTFTAENVILALSYDVARQSVQNDNYNCEIRTATSASSANFISASTNYQINAMSDAKLDSYGLLTKNNIPMDTTFNYSSSAVTDSIVCVQADRITRYSQKKATSARRTALVGNRKRAVVK